MAVTRYVQEAIDKYARAKEQRAHIISDFETGKRPFLVNITGPVESCLDYCDSIENSFRANLEDFHNALALPSDTLPHLNPWFGTGMYAEAFGCEYFWRKGTSPACHYKYHHIDEIRDIEKPNISQGKIFKMALSAIDYFKEKTNGKLPMCFSDTQSPSDIATLVLDAVEVFTSYYTEPETMHQFHTIITELVIEFSKLQMKSIGDCIAKPGQVMSSCGSKPFGISLSDDNLAVCSPKINEEFLLPYDDMIGAAFGGVALHSCGDWGHTMPLLTKMKHVKMIDCALSGDPKPTPPELIRDAFKGTDIIVQVRTDAELEKTVELLKRICVRDLRLVVRVCDVKEDAQLQYHTITKTLDDLYSS
jgi:hypothetical protein